MPIQGKRHERSARLESRIRRTREILSSWREGRGSKTEQEKEIEIEVPYYRKKPNDRDAIARFDEEESSEPTNTKPSVPSTNAERKADKSVLTFPANSEKDQDFDEQLEIYENSSVDSKVKFPILAKISKSFLYSSAKTFNEIFNCQ